MPEPLAAAPRSAANGRIVSSQFQFDPGDLSYHRHPIYCAGSPATGVTSANASYCWSGTVISADLLYGTGHLRLDEATPSISDHVPAYTTVANFGLSHAFSFGNGGLTVRFDVINAFDEKYEIRDGTGVGVGAPQFGAGRGLFFGLAKDASRDGGAPWRRWAKSRTSNGGGSGARIRRRRLFLNMTQAALAKALGVTYQQLQKYENGGQPGFRISPGRYRQSSGCRAGLFSGGGRFTDGRRAGTFAEESPDSIARGVPWSRTPGETSGRLILAVAAICDQPPGPATAGHGGSGGMAEESLRREQRRANSPATPRTVSATPRWRWPACSARPSATAA